MMLTEPNITNLVLQLKSIDQHVVAETRLSDVELHVVQRLLVIGMRNQMRESALDGIS